MVAYSIHPVTFFTKVPLLHMSCREMNKNETCAFAVISRRSPHRTGPESHHSTTRGAGRQSRSADADISRHRSFTNHQGRQLPPSHRNHAHGVSPDRTQAHS